MRRFLLLINLLFLSHLALGQISFSPNPVEVSANPAETDDVEADFEVKNDGSDTILLAWKLDVVDQPSDWQYYVCDTEICYNFNQNESSIERPNILYPGSSIIVMFHALPAKVEGVGIYNINFFDISDPDSILIEVPVNVNTVSTSTENISTKGLSLFPNPAHDFFRINTGDTVDHIVVTDLLGKKMGSYKTNQGGFYNISTFNAGIYLVRLLDEKDKVIKVLKLQKN